MNKMIWKTVLREIKGSLGRYLAILAIVALGSGFFAGLKVTKSAMLDMANGYIADHAFFDYRLISTVGYGEDEVQAMRGIEGVANAEGSVSVTALWEAGDVELVLAAHSITRQVNTTQLKAGRMPEAPNEFLGDYILFGEEDLGMTIRLAPDNEEDTADQFAETEYVLCGVVDSPAYLNFERGNTSVGNGKVSGFMYMPYEGFDVDYYTEIYLTLEATEGLYVYSPDYKAAVDGLEEFVDDAAKEQAQARFDEIVSEADEKLSDAEAEYADGLAEYTTEKADAEKELADAYDELMDAERKLADARQQYAEGEQELRDAQVEIDDGRAELADARIELDEGWAEYEDGLAEYNQGVIDYEDGLAKYEDGLAKYRDGLDEYRAGLEEYNAARDEFEALKAEVQPQLDDGFAQLDAQEETLRNNLTAVEDSLTQLENLGMQETPTYAELLGQRDAILAGLTEIDNARAELNSRQQELDDGERQLDEAEAELQKAKRKLDDAKKELDDAKKELDDAKIQLEDAKKELDDGYAELTEGEAEYADGLAELDKAQKEVDDGWAELEEAAVEIADAERKLQDGWDEYNEGKAEAEREFADAEAELADAEAELADAREELNDLEDPDVYTLDRGTNIGYACFENDASILEGIARVFPVFFLLVAALICVTTMTRMVDEQRTQIGTLKSLGYGKGAIMAKFMVYSGSAALIGGVFGFFFGTWLFPAVIWKAYQMMYSFSDIGYYFDPVLGLVVVSIFMVCILGTTWLTCNRELSEVPAELIRPRAPKNGKRIFLERIPVLWENLKFLHKVSIRNIFRYKKRMFMMILGIGGCTALLLTGYGVGDSISQVVAYQYEEITLYDCSVTMTEAVSEAEIKSILAGDGNVVDWQLLHESAVDLNTDDAVKNVNMVVADEAADLEGYIDLHLGEEKVAFPGDGEALLDENLAYLMKLEVGDTFQIKDGDMRVLNLTLSGVFDNYVNNYAVVSASTCAAQWGEAPDRQTAYLHFADAAESGKTTARLLGEEKVASVAVSEDFRDRVDSMMQSLDSVVWLIIACAGALAFIVLYNLTNINITERIREIATLKVLGFNSMETGSYVFRENLVLTGFWRCGGSLYGACLPCLCYVAGENGCHLL